MVPADADYKVSIEIRWALGFQRGPLLYAAPDTLVSVCGNQICFQDQSTGVQVWMLPSALAVKQTQTCIFVLQRLLNGGARGIECFHVVAAVGLVAYAEKVISGANSSKY